MNENEPVYIYIDFVSCLVSVVTTGIVKVSKMKDNA